MFQQGKYHQHIFHFQGSLPPPASHGSMSSSSSMGRLTFGGYVNSKENIINISFTSRGLSHLLPAMEACLVVLPWVG